MAQPVEREECAVAQYGKNPPFDQQHTAFGLGLVARAAHSGR
jgi:hypothetical protein